MGKPTYDTVCLEHFIHSRNGIKGLFTSIVHDYLGGNTISAGVFNWSISVFIQLDSIGVERRAGSPFAMTKQQHL